MAHKSRTGRLLAVVPLFILPLLIFPMLSLAKPDTEANSQLNVIQSDSEGMTVELIVPGYSSRQVENDGESALIVESPGLEEKIESPGYPELPFLSKMIALPPGATAEIQVIESDSSGTSLSSPVLPAPALTGSEKDPAVEERVFDPKAYQSDAYYPQALVTLGEPAYFRDMRVVRLEMHPFRVNSARNSLEHTSRLVVRIDFNGVEAGGSKLAAPSPEVERVLQATLLNYDAALDWRRLPDDLHVPEPSLKAGVPVFKIEIDADGMYEITFDDLVAAGIDVTGTNPISFSLSSQGHPAAIELYGDGDSVFEPGEGFYFYGQRFHGTVRQEIYTDVNVYWLNVNGPPGPRIASVDSSPNGALPATSYRELVHKEQNDQWYPVRTVNLGELDTWYWDKAVPSSVIGVPMTKTIPVQLSAVASGDFSVTVRAEFLSECDYRCLDYKHHAQILLNDALVDEQGQDSSWYNIQSRLFSGSISQSDIFNGENEFAWVLRNDVVGYNTKYVYLNWFEVEYQRKFSAVDDVLAFGGEIAGDWTYTLTNFTTDSVQIWEISDPYTPIRQQGAVIEGSGSFSVTLSASHSQDANFIAVGSDQISEPLSVSLYVPPDLDPAGGADWVAISHPDFITETRRLAGHRESLGLRAMVVDVDDVYNLFNYGIYQPSAIHDFLLHALAWPDHPPVYAVLVGDGNWNFKKSPTYPIKEIFIPPYLGFFDPYQGEVPADNQYVTLVGDDAVPDMALGRLPASSAADITVMVDKIINRDDQLVDPEPWQYTVALLADNAEIGNDFPANSELVSALIPDYFNQSNVYFGQDPYTDQTATIQAFKDAFNDGATLINFRGHGSVGEWAKEVLFHTSSIPALTNLDRLPVVTTMDCLDTYFAHPKLDSMAVELVRSANGGAVGHWGSSGLGISIDHNILNNAFYQHLFYDGITQLGLAVVAAKVDFSAQGFEQHNLQTFTLMGDPAMQVVAAELDLEKTTISPGPYYPGDPITYRIDLANHGLYWAYHSTLYDWLPPQVVSPEFQWENLDLDPQTVDPYSWLIDSILPGNQGVITVTGRIDPFLDASAGVWITNTAQAGPLDMDADPENNQDSSMIYVVQPALSVSKTAPLTVEGTSLLTYTLWITNVGSAAAENVGLADTLPENTVFHSATGNYLLSGGTVTWTLPAIDVGKSASRQLVLQSTSWFTDEIVNQEYGVWADHAGRVYGQAVTTTVRQKHAPVLVISKTAPEIIEGGSAITYTLWVSNLGSIAAEELNLTDAFPQDLDFSTASPGYSLSGNVITWTIPSLGGSEVISRQLMLTYSPLLYSIIVNQDYGVSANHVPWVAGNPVYTRIKPVGLVFLPLVSRD